MAAHAAFAQSRYPVLQCDRERLIEAERLLTRAAEIYCRSVGSQSRHTLRAEINAASAASMDGRKEQAVARLEAIRRADNCAPGTVWRPHSIGCWRWTCSTTQHWLLRQLGPRLRELLRHVRPLPTVAHRLGAIEILPGCFYVA